MGGQTDFGVVVPVKLLDAAKSRLALPPEQRRRVALGDGRGHGVRSAGAARGWPRCWSSPTTRWRRATLAALGAGVTGDEPDAGLNAALAHGAERLRAEHPRLGVATLGSDLPALTPAVLGGGLAQVRARAVVADLDGTGTTLLAAAAGQELAPAYGPDSLAAHLASGAVLLGGVDERLRRDVDTLDDLAHAAALGLGPATRAAVGRPD